MSGIDKSLLYEFVVESREHLRSLEQLFMQLEQYLERPDEELINKIFRAIHTIKGSCGFFNLIKIGQLSHTMETLLSMIREKELLPTVEILDSLLAGVDLLNAMLDDVEESNSCDINEVESNISRFLSTDESHHPFISEALSGKELSDLEEDLLLKIPAAEFLYELTYNLSSWEKESCKSPVNLVSELQKVGIILHGELLTSNEDLRTGIPTSETFYKLYYQSVLEPDLIDKVSEYAPVHIRCINCSHAQQDTNTSEQQKSDQNKELSKDDQNNKTTEKETLRVRVDILNQLMMLAGELVLVRNQQLLHQDRAETSSRAITQRLDIVTSELQETIMRTRMQPMGNVFGRFTRVVRDLAKKLHKKIEIHVIGNEVELDKNILEALVDPLTHIIRNSCDHGIELPNERTQAGKKESGTISLKAYHEGGQINIEIADDGQGISVEKVVKNVLEKDLKSEDEIKSLSDKEIISLIFLPGFSTADEVTDLSGRGVGMDVVKTSIEHLGGVIDITSQPGVGTTINLRLPLTLAIIPSLIVKVGNERFAIPQINLEELVCLYDIDVYKKIESVGTKEVYRLRDELLPMVRLNDLLGNAETFSEDLKRDISTKNQTERDELLQHWDENNEEAQKISLNFAVLKVGSNRFGLIIDTIVGTEEIVVKPMHRSVKDLPIYAGATVLGDGAVALILDVLGLARHAAIESKQEEPQMQTDEADDISGTEKHSLLLFSNEGPERFAVDMSLIKRVEKLDMKQIELIGSREFITVDGSSTRIIRLDSCLEVGRGTEREEMFLILPKRSEKAYGILTSKLIDIGDFVVEMNQDSYITNGVKGSAILNGALTLFIEPEQLVHVAEPEWYSAK